MGTGTRFARTSLLTLLEVCKRPWSLRGSRGYAPMGADGWVCSLRYAVHQMLSLLPCTVTANGAACHNRGGVVERRLPARTQGMIVDKVLNCGFNTCTGCVFQATGTLNRWERAPPTERGHHPNNWMAQFFSDLGGDALEVVSGTTLASSVYCMGAGTPFYRRTTNVFLSRLSSASFATCTKIDLPTSQSLHAHSSHSQCRATLSVHRLCRHPQWLRKLSLQTFRVSITVPLRSCKRRVSLVVSVARTAHQSPLLSLPGLAIECSSLSLPARIVVTVVSLPRQRFIGTQRCV